MSIENLVQPDTNDEDEDENTEYYWYDWHPTREDLMGESIPQTTLTRYLIAVLEWLYRQEKWLVAENLNIYQTGDQYEYPLAPDVAVFKVEVEQSVQFGMRSWKMAREGRTPPEVVFEFASKETWKEDLNRKPNQYARLGVHEYFAYDPNVPKYWPPKSGSRVRGWRYTDGQAHEIKPDKRGWLWSEELDSWLVADGLWLRLYDKSGQQRLTEAQAVEREYIGLLEKLRAHGIDPDNL